MKRAILSLAVLGFSACSAQASIVSVDFNGANSGVPGNTYSGNGVLRADGSTNDNPGTGTTTGHWDGVNFPANPNTPVPSSGLLDSNALPTGVTISLTGWAFQDNCSGCQYAHSDPNNMSLLNDYLGTQYPTVPPGPAPNAVFPTLTIGGLQQNTHYDLYIYGTNGGSTAGGTWTVGNSTKQTTGSGPNPFATFSGPTLAQPNTGDDYVVFSIDTGNTTSVTVTGSPGPINNGYVILNGFQLSPEPGSLSLLGVGAIGLLARRRRA